MLSVHDAFVHPKGAFVKFCKKTKVPKVSKRRLQIAGGTEACGTARAESRSRRCRAGDRVEVAASTPAHGSASLECQK
jgi:hypothetical protein